MQDNEYNAKSNSASLASEKSSLASNDEINEIEKILSEAVQQLEQLADVPNLENDKIEQIFNQATQQLQELSEELAEDLYQEKIYEQKEQIEGQLSSYEAEQQLQAILDKYARGGEGVAQDIKIFTAEIDLIRERAVIGEILSNPQNFAKDGNDKVLDNWLRKEYENAPDEDRFAASIIKMVLTLKPIVATDTSKLTADSLIEIDKATRSYYNEIKVSIQNAEAGIQKGSTINQLIDNLIESIKSFLGLETKAEKAKADVEEIKTTSLAGEKLGSHYKSFVEKLENERQENTRNKGPERNG